MKIQLPMLKATKQKHFGYTRSARTGNLKANLDNITKLVAFICRASFSWLEFSNSAYQEITTDYRKSAKVAQYSELTKIFSDSVTNAEILVIEDLGTDPRYQKLSVQQDCYTPIRFFVGVPLLDSQNHRIGTICAVDGEPHSISWEQREALLLLSHQAIVYLQQSLEPKKFGHGIRQNNGLSNSLLLELSAEVSKAVGHSVTLMQGLQNSADVLAKYLDAEFVKIWTFHQESSLLELKVSAGKHTDVDTFANCIPLGISIVGCIGGNRTPYCTNNVADDICVGTSAWTPNHVITAFAGYPLVVEERLVGVMALGCKHTLNESTYTSLNSIANLLAIAIDRSWAREQLLSRREVLLYGLAGHIRKSLDLDTILSTTVKEIRSLLQIDRCHFLWYWQLPNQETIAVTHEAQTAELSSLLGYLPPAQVQVLAEKILSPEITQIDDLVTYPDLDDDTYELLNSWGTQSILLLPLDTQSGQLGAIMCSHCSSVRVWTESEVELLRAVADQLVIAIDQAELYAKTRAAATAAKTQAKQLSDTLDKLKQTQAQLVQTEKMSSLGQMVAGIAHEINNPASFIQGNLKYVGNYINDLMELVECYQTAYPNVLPEVQTKAEEIDLDFINKDLPKVLNSMHSGVDRIKQIVLSLRNFSRLDEADLKIVNIHEGLDSTLLVLQHRLKSANSSAGIKVVQAYSDIPSVECYPSQLNQVFMNVLSNAIDALEVATDGRDKSFMPTITIRTQVYQETSNSPVYAQIYIADNGTGMTEETLRHLFDPFFTTKPVGKGTGLGLSIAYQIVVEKHNGDLKCTSALGEGAEFCIEIPIMQPSKLV